MFVHFHNHHLGAWSNYKCQLQLRVIINSTTIFSCWNNFTTLCDLFWAESSISPRGVFLSHCGTKDKPVFFTRLLNRFGDFHHRFASSLLAFRITWQHDVYIVTLRTRQSWLWRWRSCWRVTFIGRVSACESRDSIAGLAWMCHWLALF